MSLTEEQIAEIRERCEKATPGPWRNSSGVMVIKDNPNGGLYIPVADMRLPVDSPDNRRANAEFIAHAISDIPALLDALEIRDDGIENLVLNIEAAFRSRDEWKTKYEAERARADYENSLREKWAEEYVRFRRLNKMNAKYALALESAITSMPRQHKCPLCIHHSKPAKESPCVGCSTAGTPGVDLWEFKEAES